MRAHASRAREWRWWVSGLARGRGRQFGVAEERAFALEQVGLYENIDRYPARLSGGERQPVAISLVRSRCKQR